MNGCFPPSFFGDFFLPLSLLSPPPTPQITLISFLWPGKTIDLIWYLTSPMSCRRHRFQGCRMPLLIVLVSLSSSSPPLSVFSFPLPRNVPPPLGSESLEPNLLHLFFEPHNSLLLGTPFKFKILFLNSTFFPPEVS